jgi:AcrR family transcriptional regulator
MVRAERESGRDAAIRLGCEVFAACQRVEVGDMAERLGVSRISIYRWVGNREELLAQILWSLGRDMLAAAERRATVDGEVDFFDAYRNFNRYLVGSEPLLYFLREEPHFALRVLTKPEGLVRTNMESAFRAMLEREVVRRGRPFDLDPATLAYVIICIGESYLYPPVALNMPPNLAKAEQVVSLLLR